MNISKKELEEIIKLIVKQISEKKKINFIFSKPWNNKYYIALDVLKRFKLNANAVISKDLEESYRDIVKNYCDWKDIIDLDEDNIDLISQNDTFFLDIKMKNITNIIMFNEDELESALVMKLFEMGKEVYLWKETVKNVTGKEPENYIKKLLSYYDEILSYGIKIVDIEEVKIYE